VFWRWRVLPGLSSNWACCLLWASGNYLHSCLWWERRCSYDTHSQVFWRHEAHMLVEVLDMIADASGLLCELPFISCSTALSWQQLRRFLPSPMQLMFSW
jgi:hypothetical protein